MGPPSEHLDTPVEAVQLGWRSSEKVLFRSLESALKDSIEMLPSSRIRT